MDVTCERCSTAYEFDDALVSERGTTVKCTNCGHQFKVRREQPVGAPERWLVRTIDGRELEFRALRELQAAIAQAVISRDDVLSRGGSRPRRLGSIAELEPFFAAAGSASTAYNTAPGLGPRGQRARTPTPQGLGVISPPGGAQRTEGSVAIPLPIGPREPEPDSVDDTMVMPPTLAPRQPPPVPPPPKQKSTPPPAAYPGVVVSPAGAPALPDSRGAIPSFPFPFDEAQLAPPPPPVAPVPTPLPPPIAPARATPRPPAAEAPRAAHRVSDEQTSRSGDLPPPRAYLAPPAGSTNPGQTPPPPSGPPPALATPTPSAARASIINEESFAEPRFSATPPRRTGAARWIVGFVVGGMVVLAVATVGRKLLVPSPAPAASNAGDERITGLLADGEKRLAEGDFESAKESFDKASALGERSPKVAIDLARLAVVKADIAWLRLRLLPVDDPDQATAKAELDQAADRAIKAAARANELASSDPVVIRCRIDALRLSGDLDGARKLVGGISGAGSQPENALALASLDLAEAKPSFPTVLDRLRTALSADQGLGRARALLVYALARSGDPSGAKAEIDKLAAPKPHPLLKQLRAFVARADKAAPEGSASADAPKGSAKPSAVAVAPSPPRDRPSPSEPKDPPKSPDPPPPGAHVDTSDLPGAKPPPPANTNPPPPPAPASTIPPGVDTSDLPGFK